MLNLSREASYSIMDNNACLPLSKGTLEATIIDKSTCYLVIGFQGRLLLLIKVLAP